MSAMPGEIPTIQPVDEAPSAARLFARGLILRCVWCGDRKGYFVGWFERQERCRACGHSYRRGDHAFEIGATVLNIILTFATLLLTMFVLLLVTLPDVPAVGVALAGCAVGLLGPIVFYRLSFTLWQAFDLWMRPPTDAELAGIADAKL